MAAGSIDVLIATHRMLGKDLAFRDLGLLIVDEEQRFGVAQKERLKEWNKSADLYQEILEKYADRVVASCCCTLRRKYVDGAMGRTAQIGSTP